MKKMKLLKNLSKLLFLIAVLLINIPNTKSMPSVWVKSLNSANPELQSEDLPKYGEDSAKCVMELSLYREFYRQDNIPDAIKHWRWVFNNCPLATENTYIDGVKIVKYLMSKAEDKETKNKYIDTMMMVYDHRIKYFPKHYRTGRNQAGYILGRKGVDLIKLRPGKYKEAYEIFKKGVGLEKNYTRPAVLVYYFRSAIKMVEKGNADKALIIETYDEISDIIDYNIANNEKYSEEFKKVQDNVELTFQPFASCKDLISIYKNKFYNDPENIDLIKKITKILEKNDCVENDLFFDAAEMLHKLEPTPESAYMMGRMAAKKGLDEKAVRYLTEAVESLEGEKQADSYLLLASVLYKQEDFPFARSCAINAAKIRPDDGRPYMIIGDLYAASAKRCGDNDLTNRAPYWAAVDKYIKAKSVDESIADEAKQKIRIYSKQFPIKETIFFYNLNEGDSYTVECWINENTTVRAAK